MQFLEIRLQDFRNITFSRILLEGKRHFFLGANGVGKTNHLEAFHLVTTLRSFRAQETRVLIRHHQSTAYLEFLLEHEKEGDVHLALALKSKKKEVTVDGERLGRLADLMGRYPTVVLSSEDIHMLRGSPAMRRRFLDLTFAAIDADYFQALRHYHKALEERNALLRESRSQGADPLFEAYESLLAETGWLLYQKRQTGVARLAESLKHAYTHLSLEDEVPQLIYQPDIPVESQSTLLKMIKEQRARDKMMKSTQRGVHRDDVVFRLKSKSAKDYASEGQQRGLVIALRLAQAAYFEEELGLKPVFLVDDILGQLDPIRSERFWAAMDPTCQIIATGTTLPQGFQGQDWQIVPLNAEPKTLQPVLAEP